MRRFSGTALLTAAVLAGGACSSADATADTTPVSTTTPASSSTPEPIATTPTTAPGTHFRPTHPVDPGMVLSGDEVVTSAEVGAATDAAASG